MATVVNTTFKLKRGTAARWAEVNPILEQGEPGFVYDENRKTLVGERTNRVFKIGDTVKIRVIEANKALRKVAFELV